jgi:hypothetical protein
MNVRLILISIMLLASVNCETFYALSSSAPAGSEEVKADVWTGDVCAQTVWLVKEKATADDHKVTLVNFANAKADQVCDNTTGKLVAKKHTKAQGEACETSDDCLYNNCSTDKKCADVAKDGDCTSAVWNRRVFAQRCPSGQYCKASKCTDSLAAGKDCTGDLECATGTVCAAAKKEEATKLVCTAVKSLDDNTELLPSSSAKVCKSQIIAITTDTSVRTFCAISNTTVFDSTAKTCKVTYSFKIGNADKTVDVTSPAPYIRTKFPAEQRCADDAKAKEWLATTDKYENRALTLAEWTEREILTLQQGNQPQYEGASDDVIRYLVSASHLVLGAVMLGAALIL